jgi:hypothetical protein
MASPLTCTDCGIVAPNVDATDTRAGAEYGWRLSRRRTEDGRFVAEFRCPACWAAFRERKKPARSSST